MQTLFLMMSLLWCVCLLKPLELREVKSSPHKVKILGVWVKDKTQGERVIELATALESGR